MGHVIDTIDQGIQKRFFGLKEAYRASRYEPVASRKASLEKLRKWIHANRVAIHEAMFADFGKPAVEVDGTELFHVLNEITYALAHVEQWAKPKKVDAPITMLGTRSVIQYEPRGVCLIISPWNYPFSLAVGPLVSALSAGNTVLLKPSEMTPHVSHLLSRMVEEVFERKGVDLIEGGVEVSQQLLTLPFDHIFFTGSPAVGKIVMRAASENLASVTLELGGKSPCIVTDSAYLTDAAKRIAVGKFINNGQTCIAPDYVLVDERVADKFVSVLIEQIQQLFAEKGDFETSPHYCRIVNEKHFDRLQELLNDALAQGATLTFGGAKDRASRFMHPVILTEVSDHARVMQEEVFGPLLPVLTYKDLDEAVLLIQTKPKPLALYIFTAGKKAREKILTETSSGGVCINDCAVHFLHHHLPFGGVNNSGLGKSHGYSGFLAFSNEKPVLKQKRGFTSVQVFYPPYTSPTRKLMDWFLKLF